MIRTTARTIRVSKPGVKKLARPLFCRWKRNKQKRSKMENLNRNDGLEDKITIWVADERSGKTSSPVIRLALVKVHESGIKRNC